MLERKGNTGRGKSFYNSCLFYKRWESTALNLLSVILLKWNASDKHMIEISTKVY